MNLDSRETPAFGGASGSAPLAGLKYMLQHSRFGRATVKVLHADETWADCEVISGTMRGMGRGAVWGPGDTKTVRIEHGVWALVPNAEVRHGGPDAPN